MWPKEMVSHPRTLMLVSNTETTTSVSNVTSSITSFTAFSNSSNSPSTAKLSRVSMRVNENLQPNIQEISNIFILEFVQYTD